MVHLRRMASVIALSALILSGCGSESPDDGATTSGSPSPAVSSGDTDSRSETSPDGGQEPTGATERPEVDISSADSTTVVVNKQRPLDPQDHVPSPLTSVEGHELRQDAADALEEMLADMRQDGITVTVTSGYRSYETQVSTYDGWVAQNGQAAADRVSARPGYSEHQTGLAVDLADGSGCDLQACFAETPAGRWAAENAVEYGFILRFPEDGEGTTGYSFEPWHFRYIGLDQAREYQEAEATTMEAFYNTGPAPNYD